MKRSAESKARNNWKHVQVKIIVKIREDLTKLLVTRALINKSRKAAYTFRTESPYAAKLVKDFSKYHFGVDVYTTHKYMRLTSPIYKIPYRELRAMFTIEYVGGTKYRATCELYNL